VTLAAILYQTSTVFVFLFSMSFLREEVHPYKILAVTCCTAGVTLVAVDSWSSEDSAESGNLHVGILALLLSSMLWGLYEVFLAVLMPRASSELVNVFVGYRGASNFLLLWPLALGICLIDPTSWETVRMLPWDGVMRLCALALVSVLTTCMLTLGISWTSPVYMRLGATMASPAAILWDLSGGQPIGAMCYVGVTLTILGFVFCNLRWHYKGYHFETSAALTPGWLSRFSLPPPGEEKELENEESGINTDQLAIDGETR
jgi:drug/metabolite transporter (DMT)-like permease